jgi:hypothetical protein
MFGTTSDFTIYNDALLSASLLVKGDTNNLLVGVSAADNGARLQVGGTTTLYATFDSTSVIGAAISLRRSGVSIGAIGNSGVMGVGILDDFEMRSGIGKGLHLKTDGGSLSITTGGAATFSSSVTVGGYLTGQGTNPGGLGASRYVVDFSGGYSRFFSYGANTSTNGGILFNTQRSDGTNSIDALTIAPSGAATFSSTLQATHIGINNAPTLARLFATQTTDGEWVATFKNYGGSASYGVSIDMSGSTSNQSAFQVYTSTGNGLRLINNSRLLIGTFTDSGYQLDVNGTGRFSGTLRSNDHEIKNSANAETLDLFLSPSTFNGFIDYPSSRSLTIRNKGSLSTFTLASTGVATFSNSVGIGVSPLTRLHLQDGAPNYILLTNTAADGVVNAIQGGIIGQARGYGNNLAQMASILFRNDPISWFKGVITFSTNPTDGTDPSIAPTERMRITSEGKVLIGTDTSGSGNLIVSDNNNSGLTLRRGTTADRLLLFIGASSPYIVDDPYIQSNNADIHIRAGSTGGVKLSIGATSFVSDSDIRLKNKISDIDNALESILKLETLKFNWKYDSELENKKAYFGLSAQNVQEILPELIDVGRDDMQTLGVKYTELIPVLVKAIQELNEKLDKNNIN